MKKLMRKITLLFAMIVAFSCVNGHKAYANRLARAASGEDIFSLPGAGSEIQFAIKNLNNDSVPELIASCRTYTNVYTYVSGKLRCIASGDAESLVFYPSKGVIYSENIRRGFFGNYYYKFDGKRGKQVASKEGSMIVNLITGKHKTGDDLYENYKPYVHQIKGKKVSVKKYNSYIKQLKGKAKKVKESNMKLVGNTSKNRLKKLGYRK